MNVSALQFPHAIQLPSRAAHERAVVSLSATTDRAVLEALSDEELVVRSRHREGEAARECLAILYGRHYSKVARWCLRVCGDTDEAAEAAQEVFLRVHEKLDTFRMDSRFSTWLYMVTRSVAINRSVATRRRTSLSVDPEQQSEPRSPERPIDEVTAGAQIAERMRQAIRDDLDPLEARVLYLHHVHGLTLRTITEQLNLTNKSGAKAYLVGAKRKLRNRFGRWLQSQSSRGTRP